MAFKVEIPTLVLTALKSGPSHGYEIVKKLRESGVAKKLTEGQIYPILHKLEADGVIASEWVIQPTGPARKVYQLTARGTAELEARKLEWQSFATSVGQLLGPAKEVNLG